MDGWMAAGASILPFFGKMGTEMALCCDIESMGASERLRA
jgi:hypothetical protein